MTYFINNYEILAFYFGVMSINEIYLVLAMYFIRYLLSKTHNEVCPYV